MRKNDLTVLHLPCLEPFTGELVAAVLIVVLFDDHAFLPGMVDGSAHDLLLLALEVPRGEVHHRFDAELGGIETELLVEEFRHALRYLYEGRVSAVLEKFADERLPVLRVTDRVGKDETGAPFLSEGYETDPGTSKYCMPGCSMENDMQWSPYFLR